MEGGAEEAGSADIGVLIFELSRYLQGSVSPTRLNTWTQPCYEGILTSSVDVFDTCWAHDDNRHFRHI